MNPFSQALSQSARLVRLIAIASLFMTGLSNPSAAQQMAQQHDDDQIRIPRAGEYFEESHELTPAFTTQIQFIDMPQLYVGELAARPIETTTEGQNHTGVVSYPVALTGYETPVAPTTDDPANKAAAPARPAVAPLNWDWIPANDIPIDAKLIDQLSSSIERVKGEVAALTDEVINWTLSDQVTRIVIPVGIAYGSDTRLAHRTLLRIARENRRILKDPEPSVVFKAFGASSLDFELRIHIPSRDHFPDAVHELHMAIDDEFRRQKIEIAFPQQDVHIKGMDKMFDGGSSGTGTKSEELKKAA